MGCDKNLLAPCLACSLCHGRGMLKNFESCGSLRLRLLQNVLALPLPVVQLHDERLLCTSPR
jgi:hypothetical protein